MSRILYTSTSRSEPYRIVDAIEGAKSEGYCTPPTSDGKSKEGVAIRQTVEVRVYSSREMLL